MQTDMPDILMIEIRRKLANVPKATLCRAAGVTVSTYSRRLKRPAGGNIDTLRKLAMALSVLAPARPIAGGQDAGLQNVGPDKPVLVIEDRAYG